MPELNAGIILENMNKIQRSNQIEPSKQLEGRYNLTVRWQDLYIYQNHVRAKQPIRLGNELICYVKVLVGLVE